MDNNFQDLRAHKGGGVWETLSGVQPEAFQQGELLETKIPLSALGNPQVLGLVSYILNEAAGCEWTWAGLYAGNFADGMYNKIPITHWLSADRSSLLPPNHPSRMK